MPDPRDGLIEVEFDESESDHGEGASEPPFRSLIGAWWSGRSPRVRSAPARIVGVVVAMSCVVLVAQREAAAERAAAFASLPSVVSSLDRPVHEAWRLGDADPMGWAGDNLVASSPAGNAVELIDVVTGSVLWAVSTGGPCAVLGQAAGAAAPVTRYERGALLACPGTQPAAGAGGVTTSSPIVVVDPFDGRVSPGPTIDGALLGIGAAEGDLILAAVGADRLIRATRWSPDDRQTVWRYEGTDPVAAGEALAVAGPAGTVFQVLGDAGRAVVSLDAATGRRLSDLRAARLVASAPAEPDVRLADGSTAHDAGDATGSYRRSAADGSALPPLRGWPVSLPIDDGSTPEVALLTGTFGEVLAVDLRSGRTSWSLSGARAVGRLGGRVMLFTAGGLQLLDLRTGRPVWSDAFFVSAATAVCDGRSVAYVTRVAGVSVLKAADVGTGVVRWQTVVDGPGPVLLGAVHSGTLVVWSGDSVLTGLRP